ncbi:hypothetical protein Taro_011181 [Colocasia esculenta]|uniref:Chlororespiratory reduction 4 n=1 Tax=Colocasia esculenta TaxID=4460 RepID=A0A843U9J4_COLES|nr:hypothetical protein [Colocasia esculenta]
MSIASKRTPSCCSTLIDYCLSLRSLACAQSAHARLIKAGFHRRTFLGNRLIDLYSRLGAVASAAKVFDELPGKNTFTWNILLAGFWRSGDMKRALWLFEEMPERDVVSWNSMISGFVGMGLEEKAFGVLFRMRELGTRASGFTLSVAASCVSSARLAKQIHGHGIRSCLDVSNVVLGNALIDMYGRFRVVDYACIVFLSMGIRDVISWNTMILAYERSGFMEQALDCFNAMRHTGLLPDKFTMSIVFSVCADERNLDMGEQTFALCSKMGFLSNSIVSSGVIDMYSQCGRLDDSVRLFKGLREAEWDAATCNSMISAYARNGAAHEAQKLMVMALRAGLKPTEFTFAIILSSISGRDPTDLGAQIHSLVLKSGSETDIVISSSLLRVYAKWGAIESAARIFSMMTTKDLVCWNTMIMGYAENGHGVEALRTFQEMVKEGAGPDRITLTGVLTACSIAGLVKEGTHIFSSMEVKYKFGPEFEHYVCMVDMLSRARMFTEAMEVIELMPKKPSPLVCVMLLLESCNIHGDLKSAEVVARRAVELQAHSSSPYSVLARIYGARGRWESMARVWKAMKDRGVKEEVGCSWIAVRNQIFVFRADQLLHCGGEYLYSILRLLGNEVQEDIYDLQRDCFMMVLEE